MPEELPFILVEVEKQLQSPERMVRQNVLKKLSDFCQSDQLTLNHALVIYNQLYLNILKCYSDQFEMCRSLSGLIISALLEKLPDNDYYLACLIPAITRRIGQKEIVENSEEMRLQLLQQLNEIIIKFTPTERVRAEKEDRFLKCYNDVIDILLRSLQDPFPNALKESCALIVSFAKATVCFHYRAETLAEPLIDILRHRQSAIRISAVKALGVVTLNIYSNEDCITKVLTSLAPLLMDSIPFVRRACGRVGCKLLMKLRDRYSYFDRILPLVLCCLTDETLDVRKEIEEKWNLAGYQYFLENETEFSKFEVMELAPETYPDTYIRPSLGCRSLAQRSLKIVSPILNEMVDWKEDVRLHALKLLRVVVLHAEKSLAKYFIEINPVLSRCCMDSDKHVMAEAMRVAHLIGALVEYESWNDVAILEFLKFPKLGHLKSLHALFTASTTTPAKLKDILRICRVCMDPAVSRNTQPVYQCELLLLCEYIVTLLPQVQDHEVEQELVYNILIQVVAFAVNNPTDEGKAVQKKADTVLGALTANNVEGFHDRYLAGVIDGIIGLDSPNSDNADPIVLLNGIIWYCGFRAPFMSSMVKAIQIALENAHPDARIKIFTSIAMAAIKWRETLNGNNEHVLIIEIIDPYLVWRAGKSAEAVRSMAIAAICALSQGLEPEMARKVVSTQATVLTALVEDNNVATRSHALRTLVQMGPIDIQRLKPLAFAVLSRLDDPCAEVRELAARCLGLLRLDQHTGDTTDQSSWENVLKQIIPVMLLHLDNPEIKLKKLVVDSLQMLYHCHRDILKPILDDIPKEYPYKKDVENFEHIPLNDEKP